MKGEYKTNIKKERLNTYKKRSRKMQEVDKYPRYEKRKEKVKKEGEEILCKTQCNKCEKVYIG